VLLVHVVEAGAFQRGDGFAGLLMRFEGADGGMDVVVLSVALLPV